VLLCLRNTPLNFSDLSLIKGFKTLVKIKEQLNKENPFLIHSPFWEVLPNLIKVNKTPLLIRNQFMNKNLAHTLASEGKKD
jgi:hypothetical protein